MATSFVQGIEDLVEIGRGGFATVYRAYQPAFRRTVAVKVLNEANLDELSQERFRRECQAMGLLSEHPNIVTVLDAGFLDSGQAYMVMPFMPAGSLQDKVRREGPLPWAEASRVAVKLAGALHAAHDAGVVHRDVKPANVLISEYGETKLADFGIARVAGAGETQSGVVTASLAYAPPEVIEGKRPTVQSDIYSLGATIYDLIAGQAPFQVGGETSVAALLQKILNHPPEDLRSLGAPGPFAEVIERALAKDPAERHVSAASFGREMRLAQDELGIKPTELTILKVAESDVGAGSSEADSRQMTTPGTGGYEPEPETVGVTAATPPAVQSRTGDPDEVTRDIPSPAKAEQSSATEGKASDGQTRRRRRSKALVGAVACVVAALLGTLVLTRGGEGGDDSAATPTTEAASEGQATDTETDVATSEAGPPALDDIPSLEDLCPDGLDSTVPDPGADLGGANLECFNWAGADLQGVNFGGATLIGVDMTGANLTDASLDTTTLRSVVLRDATLDNAFVSAVFENLDLNEIDLGSADLNGGIRFLEVRARDYDFTAHFSGIHISFESSDLTRANLAGLDISVLNGSIFANAILDGAFVNTVASPSGVPTAEASVFDGASMRGVRWGSDVGPFVTLIDSSLVGADLTGADLRGALLGGADLTGTILDDADLTGAEWGGTICPDGSTSNDHLGSCPID